MATDSDPGIVQADIVEKVNAGAQLVYALYHLPVDVIRSLLDTAPDSFGRALVRAQNAYGVNRTLARGGLIRGPEQIDPETMGRDA